MTHSFPIPEIAQRTVVYRGYFDVRVDDLQSHQGARMSYTSLDIKAHAAAVLACTPEGKLLITQEYRHPTGLWLLGCPGGRIDAGESPLAAGLRELQEETGYTGSEAFLMGEVFSLPAVTDQIIHYIFIKDAVLTHPPDREPFELIHTALKSPEELYRDILAGTPTDGVLCTALLLAKSLHYL